MDKLSQVTPYVIDVNAPLVLRMPVTKLMEGDNGANTLRVQMMDGEAAANLSGYTAVGEVRREDGKRVTFACTISGNVITGTLNADCYAYPGECVATIQLAKTDGFRRTVLMIGGTVMDKGDGEIIDGGEVIEDVAGVIAMLDEMRAVTDDTKAAAQTALSSAAQADAAREGIEGEISTLKDTKAPGIEVEASGAIITIDDAAALHAAQLVSHIVPKQEGSGDPSPENVRTISGWDAVKVQRSGKNLILYPYTDISKTVNGLTFTVNDDGTVTINGTATARTFFNLDAYAEKVLPLGMLRVTGAAVGTTVVDSYTGYFTASTEGQTFNNDGKGRIDVAIRIESGVKLNNAVVKPMITTDLSATYDSYEPYEGQTLTAELPETVYGGTLDWKTGVLTVTRTKKNISDMSWNYFTKFSVPVFVSNNTSENINEAFSGVKTLCSCYKRTEITPNALMPDLCIYSHNNFAGEGNIIIRDDSCTTVDELLEKVGDQSICYARKKPYTIQLTPQQLDMLKGYNNVWSDTGDTDLVYIADTKMYFDSKISELVTLALANS